MADDGDRHTALMKEDSRFSNNYHYVMDFASIYLIDQVPAQLAASLSRRADRRKAVSKLLSWYSNGPDKVTVFAISIVLPIMLLWAEGEAYVWAWMLAVGQTIVVIQVTAVWIAASEVARRIRKRGTYVVTSLDRKGADDQVEAIRPNSNPRLPSRG